jgi:hypothetical protein
LYKWKYRKPDRLNFKEDSMDIVKRLKRRIFISDEIREGYLWEIESEEDDYSEVVIAQLHSFRVL